MRHISRNTRSILGYTLLRKRKKQKNIKIEILFFSHSKTKPNKMGMSRLIMRINGLKPTENDYARISNSIEQDLTNLHKFIPEYQEGAPLLEGVYWNIGVWITRIDAIKFIIDKNLTQVICLVKTGRLNDPKYHSDVEKLYKCVKQYDNRWFYVDAPLQIKWFCHLYDNHYIRQVVKPYKKSLILETIYVIKDKTPIVDDNICDILSFLNDEKHFTKHQVDTEIYAIA